VPHRIRRGHEAIRDRVALTGLWTAVWPRALFRQTKIPVGALRVPVGEHRLSGARLLDEAQLPAAGDALVDAVAGRIDVLAEPAFESLAQLRDDPRERGIANAIVPLVRIGGEVEELVRAVGIAMHVFPV